MSPENDWRRPNFSAWTWRYGATLVVLKFGVAVGLPCIAEGKYHRSPVTFFTWRRPFQEWMREAGRV